MPERRPGRAVRSTDRHGWTRYKRLILVTVAVGSVLVVGVSSLRARTEPPVSQPIAFSHRKHTGELQLPCDFCHKYFRTSAHSGLPGAETCGICHSVVLGTSPEAASLTETLQNGEPLQFNKLFRLPDYVFYTHRRHVTLGDLDCVNCHGGIADTDTPPERPLVEVRMALCLDCHRERGVTNDCSACHR